MLMDGENKENEFYGKDDMDLDEKNKCRIGEMDIGENKLVKNIGKVVRDLRSLGFISMAEDAYASAIFLLLKVDI